MPNITRVSQLGYNILSLHSGVLKPQNLITLYQNHGRQYNTVYNWFRNTTRFQPTPNEIYHGWEMGWTHDTITNLNAIINNVPGAGSWLTLSPVNMDGTTSFPRIGDIVKTKNLIECQIQDKDETTVPTVHRIYIVPSRTIDAIGTIAAGEVVADISFAGVGGGGQPKSRVSFPNQVDFYLQTFNESLGADGNIIPNEVWYNKWDNGGNIAGMWNMNRFISENEFDQNKGMAILIGEESDNLFVSPAMAAPWGGAALNYPILKTKGVLTHIAQKGLKQSVPVTTTTIDDILDIGLYMRSQAANSDIIQLWAGQKRVSDLNRVYKGQIQGNGTDMTQGLVKRVFGENNGFAVLGNYASFTEGDYQYLTQSIADLNDPKRLNAPGFGADEWLIAFPIAKIQEKETGNMIPNVMLFFQSGNGYSRQDEGWMHGAAGGGYVYTGIIDVKNEEWRSVEGLAFFNANQGIWYY